MIDCYENIVSQAVREGWVQFLSRYQWDWFTTMTFREQIHPEAAFKCFRYWSNNLNKQLYGKQWAKKGLSIFGVIAYEYQQRDVLHLHGLLSGPGLSDVHRVTQKEVWNELAGYARIYPPRSQDAVKSYVSKYVIKGGEIDCVGLFPAYPAALLGEGEPQNGQGLLSSLDRGIPQPTYWPG